MSTSTPPNSGPSPAPWRSLFLNHLSHLSPPEFVLSTLSHTPDGSAIPFEPRARYCIYRGMLGEMFYNAHYDETTHGKNAQIYESDMLTLTTDARMAKTSHIQPKPSDSHGPRSDTSGGGPVEAVFWIKHVQNQWRFKGQAYIVGPDIESSKQEVQHVKHLLMRNMRRTVDGPWSWSQELRSHFGNLSPAMRASFQNPTPGSARPVGKSAVEPTPSSLSPSSPIPSPSMPAPLPMQQIAGSLDADSNAIARHNFRVVVICAREVERLDLGEQRRWRWRRMEGDCETGSWGGCDSEEKVEGLKKKKGGSDCESEVVKVLERPEGMGIDVVGSSNEARVLGREWDELGELGELGIGTAEGEWVMEELWP